jgi:hypothetical protein
MTQPDEVRALRPQFLLEVYKQMMADINRHIMVVWQSIGVVIGSFAVMGLVEKKVISLDYASSLLLLVCSWSLGLLIDASYWYNRNLCIVANIERLFLEEKDLQNVHYYFGKHRPNNRMITTMKIQVTLSLSIGIVVICYHFYERVVPGIGLSFSSFDVARSYPYIIAVLSSWLLFRLKARRSRNYAEFLKNSPGVHVNTENILYGEGHGFRKEGG